MGSIRINKTSVRTSENYQINDCIIELPNIEKENLTNNSYFMDLDNDSINVSNEIDEFNLTYGNGKELENISKEKANIKLKVNLFKSSDKDNLITIENKDNLVDVIEIVVNEKCEGSLTIKYCNELKNGNGFHNGIIKVILKKESKMKLTILNLLDESTINVLSMDNNLDDNAVLDYNIVDFGGSKSISNYYTSLDGEKSENNLNTIYLGDNNQFFDINYIIATKGINTRASIDVQGALKDNAKKHFKGTIDFKRGSKKAVGEENESCILLSDTAKSISLPMLLCDEEDVVGNHSTSAGKIGGKELFYLMSRGFTEKESKTLMVRAKFNRVIDSITNKEIKKEVLEVVNSKLDNGDMIIE